MSNFLRGTRHDGVPPVDRPRWLWRQREPTQLRSVFSSMYSHRTHSSFPPARSSFLFLSSTLRPVLWRSRGWCVARRCQCFLCGVCCDAKGAHGERLGDPLLDCFIHSHEVLRACAPLMIARRVPSGALLRPLRRRMSVVPAFSQQPSQTCRRRPLRRHGRGSL